MAELRNLSRGEIDPEATLDDYTAYGGDGEKLGEVDGVIVDEREMQPRYLVVESGGWFRSSKFVVPIGEVNRIDESEKRVYFKTLSRARLSGGEYPKYDHEWWEKNDYNSFSAHERELKQTYSGGDQQSASATGADSGEPQGANEQVDYSHTLYRPPAEGARRLQLLEEKLRVSKQREQAGEVHIGKRLVSEQRSLSVPLRQERLVVERRPGGGQPAQSVGFGEQTVAVPLTKETVDVAKETVVGETVTVRKETSERTQQVQETLRKEELDVQDSGDLALEHGRPPASSAS